MRGAPEEFPVGDVAGEVDSLQSLRVHRHGRHEDPFGEALLQRSRARNEALQFIELLDRIMRVGCRQLATGRTGREINIIIENDFHPQAPCRFQHLSVALEVFLR